MDIFRAPSTDSTPSRKLNERVQSTVAWERVLDRARMKLKGKPARTVVFGRAGLRWSKMNWMRKKPDLRASVIVKLALGLGMKPEKFFALMLAEEAKLTGPPSPR